VLAQPGQGFLTGAVARFAAARLSFTVERQDGAQVWGSLGVSGTPGGTTVLARMGVSMRFDVLRKRRGAAWAAVETGAR
jgi:hypothetical protein